MAYVLSVSRAFPEYSYPQSKFTEETRELLPPGTYEVERLQSLHRNVRVGHRYAALPLTEMAKGLGSFTNKNDAYIKVALEIVEKSVRDALVKAGLRAEDVDHIFFVSVTGLSNPSLETRLLNRFHGPYDPSKAYGPDVGSFHRTVRRTSIFGVGCTGGGTITNRTTDYLYGNPKGVALAISVELFTLTIRWDDTRIANLVATGLFGDAAATIVMCGEEYYRSRKEENQGGLLDPTSLSKLTRMDNSSFSSSSPESESSASSLASSPSLHASSPPSTIPSRSSTFLEGETPKPSLIPKVVATRALFYPETEDHIAWEIGTNGFTIILSKEVSKIIRPHLYEDVMAFLLETRADAAAAPASSSLKSLIDSLPSSIDGIANFIVHPGGPKVLRTVADCLSVYAPDSEKDLSEAKQSLRGLETAWQSLEDFGNCSSASVVMILEDTINSTIKSPKSSTEATAPVSSTTPAGSGTIPSTLNLREGDYSLLIAFGPGFTIEMSLMQWHRA